MPILWSMSLRSRTSRTVTLSLFHTTDDSFIGSSTHDYSVLQLPVVKQDGHSQTVVELPKIAETPSRTLCSTVDCEAHTFLMSASCGVQTSNGMTATIEVQTNASLCGSEVPRLAESQTQISASLSSACGVQTLTGIVATSEVQTDSSAS